LRLLIATNRPAVFSFFGGLREHGLPDLLAVRIAVSADEPADDQVAAAAAVVVDLGFEPGPAVELCRRLHEQQPLLHLVGLLCCPQSLTPWHLRELVASGIRGLLDLKATPEEAVETLQSIMRGHSALHVHLWPEPFLNQLLGHRTTTSETRVRILELLSLGLSQREIARRLHLSPHTVKHHVEDLRSELRLKNSLELAAWAGRHGFYSPERTREPPRDRAELQLIR
jgi:DNA-binding NarL/FixJ family response regulator